MMYAIRNDGLGYRRIASADDLLPDETLSSGPIQIAPDINDERDRRWRAGFECAGKWFKSDEFSLVQYLGLKDAAAGLADNVAVKIDGAAVEWQTMDGTKLVITAKIARDLVDAARVHQIRVFAAAEAFKNNDPTAAWPAQFGE